MLSINHSIFEEEKLRGRGNLVLKHLQKKNNNVKI